MASQKLFIASDHGGYHLKKRLLRFFEHELKIAVTDLGPHTYVQGDDYPDYAIPLSKKVARAPGAKGILICKNGIGVCMAANKVRGIRAGIGYNIAVAESMRTDDNTNILCLGAEHVSENDAIAIVARWLKTPFSNAARHKRRLKKI